MDLSTARRKLENDEYNSVEQWKDDMELIWNNTFSYNGQSSLISLLAKEIQSNFRELTVNFSSDAEADWNAQFDKLKSELNSLIKSAPKFTTQQKQIRRSTSSVSSTFQPAAYGFGFQMNQQSSQSVITRSAQKNSTTAQKQVSQKSAAQKTVPPQKTTFSGMTPEEIKTLTEEVNLIEDPEQVQQVIDLVKKLEPSLNDDANEEEEFVLDIEKLKEGTLVELRALVSQILGH